MMAAMEDRAETLRRRIALFRRYLEEGADCELAGHYLREIMMAGRELERLSDDKRR